MGELPQHVYGKQHCLSEMLMIDSNKGPMLTKLPDRTEGGNLSKEHLNITEVKSSSEIGEEEINDSVH